jgi:LytS/YehU family sensor histidine kinase
VAELLRATLEEQRDEVTLADEWRFVSRYLAVEGIRFGDRLVVRADLAPDLLDERVPAFALQTLVENAARLVCRPAADGGRYEAVLVVPRERRSAASR